MFKKIICPILIIGLITGCSKSNPTPPATTLTINVKSSSGSSVSGATVYLFSSSNDMTNAFQSDNFNGAVATQNTDGNGNAVFNAGLSAQQYYYYVKDGCENNFFSGNLTPNSFGSNTQTLALNENNTAACTLIGVGTLTLVNNSSNPYELYANDNTILKQSMAGNSSISTPFPAIQFELEWKQLSGYLISPTIDSTNVNLSCGGSQTVTFP